MCVSDWKINKKIMKLTSNGAVRQKIPKPKLSHSSLVLEESIIAYTSLSAIPIFENKFQSSKMLKSLLLSAL